MACLMRMNSYRHKHGIQTATETKVDGTVNMYVIYYYPEKPDLAMSLERMDRIEERYVYVKDYKGYSQFIKAIRQVYEEIDRLNSKQCLPINVVIDELI